MAGWQDAPIVEVGGWESAPIVDAGPPGSVAATQGRPDGGPMDVVKGIYAGLHRLPQSVFELGARATDALGVSKGAYDMAHDVFTKDTASYTGNSKAGQVGDIGGQILGTAPLAMARLPKLAGMAPGFVRSLGMAGQGAVQGAGGAALTSSASDLPIGSQVGLGAAFGGGIPLAGAAVRGAADLVPGILGNITTGAGASSVREAFRAGRKGGESGKAFTSNMRGQAPMEEVVSEAKAALGNMRKARSDAYKSGMVDVKNDAAVLSFEPIEQAMAKTSGVKNFKGIDTSPKTAGVRKEIDDAIAMWKGQNPTEYHTPEGFDALKQMLGDIKDDLPFGSAQRTVADTAYNAVRGSIAKQAPGYAKVMEDYSKASDELANLQRELSLGPKGNPTTALKKLQSVMRDNVDTSWGGRAKLADRLVGSGAKDLLPKLAGQALSSSTPRGLSRVLAGGAGGLGYMAGTLMDPTFLAGLAATSPRLVGEGAYALGSGVRGAANVGGLFGASARALAPRTAAALGSIPRTRLNPVSLGVLGPALVQ